MQHPPAIWPRPEVRRRIVETARGPVDLLEAGRGSPVLYFHGTAATGEVVAVLEHALVEAGFRLIVPSRPGYHGTPLSSGRTPNDCADLGAALLDRLEIEQVAVIGTSGGGPAAASFTARHPERTTALVLQCALSHPYSAAHWMPGRMKWLSRLLKYPRIVLPLLRLGVRRELHRLRRSPHRIARNMSGERYAEILHDPATGELASLLVETLLLCAQQPCGLENDWANATGEPWLRTDSIRAPTRIFHDRADPLVPFTHAEWALRSIAGAELCELHVGGHLIWLGADAPRMRREREAFLRQHAITNNENQVNRV